MICRIGNGTWYQNGVSTGAIQYYNNIIKLFNAKRINMLLKFLATSCGSEIQKSNCRLQLKEILNLINFDLQEPRTKECLELLSANIDTAGSNLLKLNDVKECLKYIC